MLLGQALLTPVQHAVFPHPSFVMYGSIVLAHGGPFTAVPLKGLEHDLEAMSAAIREDTSLVIVCNPNNPTGGYIEPEALRAFISSVPQETVVVLDEAYEEFVTSLRHIRALPSGSRSSPTLSCFIRSRRSTAWRA